MSSITDAEAGDTGPLRACLGEMAWARRRWGRPRDLDRLMLAAGRIMRAGDRLVTTAIAPASLPVR